MILAAMLASGGCATIRTTDPPRTATEQFLMSVAATRAIDQLSSIALRGRRVYTDSTYLGSVSNTAENAFLQGELRARLLLAGVQLVSQRSEAEIILEIRSGGLGIDRLEFLLGIPALYLGGTTSTTPTGQMPVATPELALIKSTRQRGYASVAFVAYWTDTGELVASSGPFVGRTFREDYWFFGVGPRTVGNIPPAER